VFKGHLSGRAATFSDGYIGVCICECVCVCVCVCICVCDK